MRLSTSRICDVGTQPYDEYNVLAKFFAGLPRAAR